jgi:hypothetical protein
MGAPRAELFDEPRLPDAGLPGHKDELGPPALGLAPQGRQLCPLGSASDERGATLSSGLAFHGFPLRRQQRLVSLARWRRRLDAQLALQGRHARVVHPKRPRPIPARVVQAHKEPVCLLAERVVPHQPLGAQDRLGIIAARFEKRGEALEDVEVALAKPLALFEEPLVVAPLEKVSRVQFDSLPQRGEATVGGFSFRPRE